MAEAPHEVIKAVKLDEATTRRVKHGVDRSPFPLLGGNSVLILHAVEEFDAGKTVVVREEEVLYVLEGIGIALKEFLKAFTEALVSKDGPRKLRKFHAQRAALRLDQAYKCVPLLKVGNDAVDERLRVVLLTEPLNESRLLN
jgi:hypothetical protein